jgi:hypothetical protein
MLRQRRQFFSGFRGSEKKELPILNLFPVVRWLIQHFTKKSERDRQTENMGETAQWLMLHYTAPRHMSVSTRL